jgi:hypothetical protein
MHQHLLSSKAMSIVYATLMLLTACHRQQEAQASATPLAALAATATHTSLPPSATPSPSPTVIPPTVTPTPLPTLEHEEKEAMLKQLIQENRGCRLPCWWGFTPGEAQWDMVQKFMQPLLSVRLSSSKGSIAVYVARASGPAGRENLFQRYVVEDGIVTEIESITSPEQYGSAQVFIETWRPYLLPGLFATYGKPEEVRLLVFGPGPDPGIVYYLLVSYLDQGFLAYYRGEGSPAGQNFRLCPSKSKLILLMWHPGEYHSLEEAIVQPNPDFHPAADHRPIQDVTNMSADDFFDTFNTGNANTCFETPEELW